jgi:hypothetical protein
MNRDNGAGPSSGSRLGRGVAITFASLLLSLSAGSLAQETSSQDPLLPPDQLDSLVAPIALYPDDLLAQTLVASTYPLEIIQLQQWLGRNPDLKGQALTDAVANQPWDPSVQSMAALPEVVKRLGDDITWTTDLGNAFLAQQADVMAAIQRMRQKAQSNGALASNKEQIVETQKVDGNTVIIVQPANPEVIYVPSYSPTVVYGPPIYPYPPIYYPYYRPGAAFVSFSFGVAIGAAWGGSCCGFGWGRNDIDIDINNNFNRIDIDRTNINSGNRANNRGDGKQKWQHDPKHRGAAPYSNKATASKYGGTSGAGSRPGPSSASREASAKSALAGGGAGTRQHTPMPDRSGAGQRASTGSMDRSAATDRAGAADRSGAMDRGGASNRAASSNRVGNYDAPRNSSARSSGFGSSSGYNGNAARAHSSRGASSMSGHRSGGGRGR